MWIALQDDVVAEMMRVVRRGWGEGGGAVDDVRGGLRCRMMLLSKSNDEDRFVARCG